MAVGRPQSPALHDITTCTDGPNATSLISSGDQLIVTRLARLPGVGDMLTITYPSQPGFGSVSAFIP